MADSPEKRSNGWRVRWRYRNEWKVERHYLIEEFEADAWLAKRYLDAMNNAVSMHDPRITQRRYLRGDVAPVEAAPHSFLEVAQAYERTKTWSEGRTRSFRTTLKNHYHDWADFPIEQLKDDHLNDKWHALSKATYQPSPRMAPRPYKRNSMIAIMEVALQVLTYAHRKGMLGNRPNPAQSPDLAFNRTMTKPPNRLPLQGAEIAGLLRLADENTTAKGFYAVRPSQHADTIRTMVSLGLRIGEVLSLAVQDIDFVEKIVYVGHTIARGMAGARRKGTKKGEHVPPRPLGVSDKFLAFIKPYTEGRPGAAPLFPGVMLGKFQHPDEWRSTIWTPLAELAVEKGILRDFIDRVPHITRYTAIKHMKPHAATRDLADFHGHGEKILQRTYMVEDLEAQREAHTRAVPDFVYGLAKA